MLAPITLLYLAASGLVVVPVLRQYYRNTMAAQPNLALDLIIPPLSRFVSIWTAGRIFLALTAWSLGFGCIALHRALYGHWSVWPTIGFLFVYNRLLFWGFLGYLFGRCWPRRAGSRWARGIGRCVLRSGWWRERSSICCISMRSASMQCWPMG